MRLIYCQGFSRCERLEWKPIIFHNIIGALRTIYRAMIDMNYHFEIIENNVGFSLPKINMRASRRHKS
jgi:guanine nucleotide-binding protein subunit alpha